MTLRLFLSGAAVALTLTATTATAETLRLSHQWSNNDIRHKVAEMLAEEVKAANVDLEIQIFPNAQLYKASEQWNPVSTGQLDMTVYPLSYAGGKHPEFNLTLMPALVKNHAHAARLNKSTFMQDIEAIAEEDGVKILVHGWLAGGFAGKNKCIREPDDMQGMQTRAAGKAFEQMLAAAGASIASMSSDEIYTAMQTGVLDAVNTSSSSFVSFRLYELVACYTPPGEYALWFMYQPVLISTETWEDLDDAQRAALEAAAAKAEAWYAEEGAKEDTAAVETFQKAGVEIAEMTQEEFAKWRELATNSSFKAFVESAPDGQALLDKALAVE